MKYTRIQIEQLIELASDSLIEAETRADRATDEAEAADLRGEGYDGMWENTADLWDRCYELQGERTKWKRYLDAMDLLEIE